MPGILHKWVEVYPVNPAAVHGEYLRDITKREQTANYLVHCSSAAKERGSYHHRDLRRALTRSALEILSEAGVAGLSLRAAARRAKVSAMAPYRHFADKEALPAAVAEHGFQLLEARLTTATATASDPRGGLAALGVAYVLFARDEPSLFKLMFGPAIEKKSAHSALGQAGYACFDALRQAVEAARFFDNEPDLNDVSLACWSLVHAYRHSSSTAGSRKTALARPKRLRHG